MRAHRADDDSNEDGVGREDEFRGFSHGNSRSFTVTADPFCELLSDSARLVKDFPINLNRMFPVTSGVVYLPKNSSGSVSDIARQ